MDFLYLPVRELCLIFGKVSFKTYLKKEISVRFATSHHILNEYCCRTIGMHGSLKRIDETFLKSHQLSDGTDLMAQFK